MKRNYVFKIFIICMIIMTAMSGSFAVASAAKTRKVVRDIKVLFNGAELNLEGTAPYVHKNNLMLPVKEIVEEFGATVTKNEPGKMMIDNYKHIITLTAGSKMITVDNGQRFINDCVVDKASVFYASSDLLAQDFDIAVSWDKKTNICNLDTKIEVERLIVDDMQIASIRFRAQYTDIADYYLALAEAVGADGLGGGFSLYYDQDYERGHDIEICMQISQPFDSVTTAVNGKEVVVSCRVLEGGELLSATHLGNSDTIQYLWIQIEQYAIDNGINFDSPAREIYVYEDFNDYRKQVTTVQIPIINDEPAVPQVQATGVYINGEKLDLNNVPVYKDINQTFLLPAQLLAEKLGAAVTYNADKSQMTVKHGKHTLKVTSGSPNINVDGKQQSLSADCLTLNNNLYVPADFFNHFCNVKGDYDSVKDTFRFVIKKQKRCIKD